MNQNSTYNASATHEDWGGEAATGVIRFDQRMLQFHSEAAQLTVELSLDDLTIEATGARGVSFQDETQPEWRVQCNDPAVLNDYFIKRRIALSSVAREIQQRRAGIRNLKLAAAFLVGFAILFLAIVAGGKVVLNLALKNISPAREAELGKKVWEEEFQEGLTVIEDPALKKQLESTVALIARGDADLVYKYDITIVEHSDPNALALPGGKILVFTGLFDVLDRPEQIAGILAHEVAHVQRRHGLRTLLSHAGPLAALTLMGGSEGNIITALGQGSQFVVGQHYSREREREADEVGWELVRKARIDPRGLAAALRKLQAWEDQDRPNTRTDKADNLFASHPPTSERIQHLESLWAKLPSKPTTFAPLPRLRPTVKNSKAQLVR